MKLTWTFYPGNGVTVSLTVIYVPELDREPLSSGGFLEVEGNVAYVNWATFKLFDQADVKARQYAYQRLVRLAKGGGLQLPSGSVIHWPLVKP